MTENDKLKSGEDVSEKMIKAMADVYYQATSGLTTDEMRYVVGMVEPFSPNAIGTRIPLRYGEKTLTFKERLEINLGAITDGLFYYNFLTNKLQPAVLFTGAQLSNVLSTGTSGFIPTIEYYTNRTCYSALLASAGSSTSYGSVLSQDVASGLRLVAGGIRLIKTSKSTTEGGVIKAIYIRKSTSAASDLSDFIDNMAGSSDYIRITPSAMNLENDREGNLLQVNYKP